VASGKDRGRRDGQDALQNELTHLADDIDDRVELDRRVRAVADREQLSPSDAVYVHQWEDIRRNLDGSDRLLRPRPRARRRPTAIPAYRPR